MKFQLRNRSIQSLRTIPEIRLSERQEREAEELGNETLIAE